MPGSVHALRLHNLLLAGALTSAQLDDALASPALYGAFLASLRQRSVLDAITSSSHALPVVLASQCVEMFVLAVIEIPAFFTRLFAKSATRLQLYNSDVALAALSSSAAAIAALRKDPAYKVVSKSTGMANTTQTIAEVTGPCILVGCSASSATTLTFSCRRPGSTVGALSLLVAVGATATTDNVMAIASPATVSASISSVTAYFGLIPV